MRNSLFFVVITSIALSACTYLEKPEPDLNPQAARQELEKTAIYKSAKIAKKLGSVYYLVFDNRGRLLNPEAITHAAQELPRLHPRHIAVVSFGWNYSRDDAEKAYEGYLSDYQKHLGSDRPLDGAIFCVVWQSKMNLTGSLEDLLPLPYLAEELGEVPNDMLLPFTFWAKAGLADRIGRDDLRDSLEYLYDEGFKGVPENEKPPLYLIGHSFGCRALNKLIPKDVHTIYGIVGDDLIRKRYSFWCHIAGAVFLQPAMTSEKLRDDAQYVHFPLVVTSSRYDHATGFLFPIANLPVNTSVETFSYLGHTPRSDDTPWRKFVQRPALEMGALVGSSATGLVQAPFSYLLHQTRHELAERPQDYLPNTLAQVPVARGLVEHLQPGNPTPDQQWGMRRGLLAFGPLHDALGRLDSPNPLDHKLPASRIPLEMAISEPHLKDGLIYVDCSRMRGDPDPNHQNKRIRQSRGEFGENLANPWADYTVGWLDPVGAHSNVLGNPDIFDLISKVVAQKGAANK